MNLRKLAVTKMGLNLCQGRPADAYGMSLRALGDLGQELFAGMHALGTEGKDVLVSV